MTHGRAVAVVGLGYVGLPVAVSLGRAGPVIGFDSSAARVEELRAGRDRTGEVQRSELGASNVIFTSDPAKLSQADFFVIAVPTPIDEAQQPDLGPLLGAARVVGSHMRPGSIVVFESTVYPGATEEQCVPVLEAASGLACGADFKVGYSPERINPGDRQNSFETIIKVVSAQDAKTLDIIATVYASVVRAGVYEAASIKVAEAAKVIENTQRDLNIALMNELALIFDRMDIDTRDVLAAAGTKWNFLPFSPGLVGGHCIGVDPYYLTHKASLLKYHPQVILAGRRINDGMGLYVAGQVIKHLIRQGANIRDCAVTILGLTFKENVSDLRNTRVTDIVSELKDFGAAVQVHDPLASAEEARRELGLSLCARADLAPAKCVVLAVAHEQFVTGGWALVSSLLEGGRGVVADVRGILPRDEAPAGVVLWRL